MYTSSEHGKCITGDTILFTENGLEYVEDIFNREKLYKEIVDNNIEVVKYCDFKIVNKNGDLENTNGMVINGNRRCYTITTSDGYEITATDNHPLLVITEDGLEWKKIEDLTVNDYLCVQRGCKVFGETIKLNINFDVFLQNRSKFSQAHLKDIPNFPMEMNKDLAYLMGILTGDGCLTIENRVMFTNIDGDIVQRFKQIVNSYGLSHIMCKENKDYIISSIFFREYLRQLDMCIEKANFKYVPRTIMCAPKECVIAFLQGLFDTDGSIEKKFQLSYCSKSKRLIREVQLLLLNFGIISHIRKKYNKKFNTYAYELIMSGKNIEIFYKEIGFFCKRKQNILKSFFITPRVYNVNKDILPYQGRKIKFLDSKNREKDKIREIQKERHRLSYFNAIRFYNYFDKETQGIIDKHYYYDKIISIEDVGEKMTYDISVSKSHSFIGNGIVNHNTLLDVLYLYFLAIMYPRNTIKYYIWNKRTSG